MKTPARKKLLKDVRKRRMRKHMRVHAVLGILAVFFCGALVWGLAYLSRLPSVLIAAVRVEGAEVVDIEALRGIVDDKIAGSYLFIFPRSNVLLYPKDAITKMIAENDTRIKSVAVTRDGREIVVTIVEHAPSYVWCDTLGGPFDVPEDTADERCFFANDAGYIFAEAPQFSGSVYIVLRGPLYGEGADPRGKLYLPPEQFTNISVFLDLLKQEGIMPDGVRAMGDGDYAIVTRKGSEIKFSITQDPARLADNLQSAAAILADKDLEYIDLRFGNKVFYK